MDALFEFKLAPWLGRIGRFVNVSRHIGPRLATVIQVKALPSDQIAEGQLLLDVRSGTAGNSAQLSDKRGALF